MMKKRIILVFLVMILGGCTHVVLDTSKNGSSQNGTESSGIKEGDNTTGNIQEESNVDDSLSRNDYVRNIFAEYGYTAPAENEWIVNEEGHQKVAVIIKENIPNGKPNITKIVFLEGATNEIVFLQINNKIIIKG